MALKDSVLNIVIRAKDSTAAGFQKVRASLSGTDKETKSLGQSIGGVIKQITALAAAYLSIRSITGFFTGAVRESAEFQEQLARVQAVTQASAEDMDRLKAAATEMGAATTYTAVQAAEAMENLSRAGLSTDETLQALPEVLALARGNSIELAEAASLITQSIQGMGGSFDESAKYADILTRAAQRANTDVTGLGQALSYAAPTARSLGLEAELTAALIGKLADSGIDASRAGTALNSIFSQFQNPASTFRRELDKIGITTNDFGMALEQLEASGDKGRGAITAVGQEAGPALRALLAQGTGSLRELEAELKNSAGAAQTAADTMDDTLPGAIERLQSAWRTLKRALGDNVLESAKGAIDELADGIRNLVSGGRIEELGQKFKQTFETMVGQVRNFLQNFDIDDALDKAGQAMTTLGTIASKTGATLTILGQSINAVWQGINFVVGGVMATITKAAAGFGLVVNKMVQGLNKVGLVSDETAASFEMHTGALNAMADAIANDAVDSLKKAGESIVKVGQATVDLTRTTEQQTSAQQNQNRVTEEGADALEKQAEAADQAADKMADVTEQVDEQAALVKRLREEYEELKASGTATPQQLAEALKRLDEAQTEATEGALSLEQAYDRLGTTSQAQLIEAAEQAREAFETIRTSGTASALDVEQAFLAYAKAAKEAGDQATIANAKAAGAALGLSGALDDMGEKGKAAGESTAEATKEAAKETENLKDETEAAGDAAEEAAKRSSAFGAFFAAIMTQAREAVSALSIAARNLFERRIGGNEIASAAETTEEALARVQSRLTEVNASIMKSQGWLTRWALETEETSLIVQKEFYEQALAAERMQRQVEAGAYSLDMLANLAQKAKGRFNLLDDEDLSGLTGAIAQAQRQMESLNSSAEDTLTSMRRRLADIRGDTEESQRIQYETERKRLQELLEQAERAGADEAAADYNQSLDTLDKIYQLEQKKNREAEQERQREQQERQEREQQERERQRNSQRTDQTAGPQGPATQTVKTVTVNLGGQSFRVLAGDETALMRALESARGTSA